jgi:hypothetical protein
MYDEFYDILVDKSDPCGVELHIVLNDCNLWRHVVFGKCI